MAGRRNLSVLHTALAVGLAEGKCSPALCLPHEPSPYAVRFSIPEWQNGGDCQFRTRSRQSVWQRANVLPCWRGFVKYGIQFPYPHVEASCSAMTICIFRSKRYFKISMYILKYLSPSHEFSSCIPLYRNIWGMGLAPWLRKALDLRPLPVFRQMRIVYHKKKPECIYFPFR